MYPVNAESTHPLKTTLTHPINIGPPSQHRHPLSYCRLQVRGSFHSQTLRQKFIKTSPTVLTYGMCGGPCLLQPTTTNTTNTTNTTTKNNPADVVVCGLLEGIIPVDHPDAELRGLGSIVDNTQILGFVQDVEAGVDHMTAQGHVLLQVGGLVDV